MTLSYPRRLRLLVKDTSGNNQLGLLWGFRSRYYDPASTAALFYEAEALVPVLPASVVSLSGASGGRAVKYMLLPTSWTPVLDTDLLGVGPLTHCGTYRVWVRGYTTSADQVQLRLAWAVGTLVNPTVNNPVTIPGASQFYLLDLGNVRLDKPAVGSYRWEGQIQAMGELGGENVYLDAVYLQPLDDGAGVLTCSPSATVLSAPEEADSFNEAAGNLTGKGADIGGVWSGADASSDFTLPVSAGHLAERTATSDSGQWSGRFVTLPPSLSSVRASVALSIPSLYSGDAFGVLARFVNTSNWVMLAITATEYAVFKSVAGTVSTILSNPGLAGGFSGTLILIITASGDVTALAGPLDASATDPDLASGGPLATGQAGLYDSHPSATALTRIYSSFVVVDPSASGDAVIYGGQGAELRYDGMLREGPSGTYYGPVSQVTGDLPRLPASGMENRPVEVFVRPTRGDLTTVPDSGLDGFTAQAIYRSSYLFRP